MMQLSPCCGLGEFESPCFYDIRADEFFGFGCHDVESINWVLGLVRVEIRPSDRPFLQFLRRNPL